MQGVLARIGWAKNYRCANVSDPGWRGKEGGGRAEGEKREEEKQRESGDYNYSTYRTTPHIPLSSPLLTLVTLSIFSVQLLIPYYLLFSVVFFRYPILFFPVVREDGWSSSLICCP